MNVTASAATTAQPVDAPTRRLLVVDDDNLVLESIAEYLEDSGYHVTSVNSARDAMDRLSELTIDLLICDLKMPEMGGLSLLSCVREQRPSLPVIVVSGAGDMNDVVSALRLGASDYLVKPILNLEVLVHSVQRSLKQADLVAQNERYKRQLEDTNARLKHSLSMLEEDQLAARAVQLNMLPPEQVLLSKVNFEHLLMPSLLLSGDFVDYQPLGGSKTFFYMADVSGHGASSALVTVLLKSSLQRYFELLKASPALVASPLAWLKRVHTDLKRSNLGKHFTCFAGLYDAACSQLTYCIAGHYPKPILVVNGQAQFLESAGMPVGLMQDLICDEKEIMLNHTPFSLFACSDGLLEVMPVSSLADKENSLLGMAEKGQLSVKAVRQYVEQRSHFYACIPDDITLLSIRCESQ